MNNLILEGFQVDFKMKPKRIDRFSFSKLSDIDPPGPPALTQKAEDRAKEFLAGDP